MDFSTARPPLGVRDPRRPCVDARLGVGDSLGRCCGAGVAAQSPRGTDRSPGRLELPFGVDHVGQVGARRDQRRGLRELGALRVAPDARRVVRRAVVAAHERPRRDSARPAAGSIHRPMRHAHRRPCHAHSPSIQTAPAAGLRRHELDARGRRRIPDDLERLVGCGAYGGCGSRPAHAREDREPPRARTIACRPG